LSKHLKAPENAGLVTRGVDRQTRLATLKVAPMQSAVGWLEEFHQFWTGSFDQPDALPSDLTYTQRGPE